MEAKTEAELSLISDAFIARDYPVQRVDSLIQNYTRCHPKATTVTKRSLKTKETKSFSHTSLRFQIL